MPQFIFLANKTDLHIYSIFTAECFSGQPRSEVKQLRLICVHTKSNTHWDPLRSSSNFCHRHDLHLKLNPANHVPQRPDKLLGSHNSSHYVNFLPHNRCTTLSVFDAASNSVRAHRLMAPPAVRSAANQHFGDSEKSRLCVRNHVDHAS